MTAEPSGSPAQGWLREDLSKEYYALLDAATEYGNRSMTIKGWSVTLSLVLLGLGFEKQHYALFGLGAVSALAFWYLDFKIKGFQLRYYVRMRDIEVAMYHINNMVLDPEQGPISSPRIDSTWVTLDRGSEPSSRGGKPEPLSAAKIRHDKNGLFIKVWLPHAAAVVLGACLYWAGMQDAWGMMGYTP